MSPLLLVILALPGRCLGLDQEQSLAQARHLLSVQGQAAEHSVTMLPSDADPEARIAAATALGERGGDANVRLLEKAMRDKDADVRLVAARSLRAHDNSDRARLALQAALLDRSEAVRREAVLALAIRKEPEALELLERLYSASSSAATRFVVIAALFDRNREDCVDLLQRAADDPNARVRRAALQALFRLDSIIAFRAIERAAGHDDPDTAVAAIRLLGARGHRVTINTLLALASHKDARVQAAAVEALGQIGEPAVVVPLTFISEQGNAGLREAIDRAVYSILSRLPRPEAAARIHAAFKSPPPLRGDAAMGAVVREFSMRDATPVLLSTTANPPKLVESKWDGVLFALSCGLLTFLLAVELCFAFLMILTPLSLSGQFPMVGQLGAVHLQVLDAVLVFLAAKVVCRFGLAEVAQEFRAGVERARVVVQPLGLYCGVMFLATLLQPHGFKGAELVALARWIAHASIFAMFLACPFPRRTTDRLLQAVYGVGLFFAGSVIVHWLLFLIGLPLGNNLFILNRYAIRCVGLLADHSAAGTYLVFFFLWALALAAVSRAHWVAAGIFGMAFLLTGTRGALVPLAFGLGVLAYRAIRRGVRLRAIVLLAAVFIVCATAVPFLRTSFLRFFHSGDLHAGVATRLNGFARAIEMFKEHPVLGVGFTGARFFLGNYKRVVSFEGAEGVYNQYLTELTNGGLLGFGAFVFLVVQMALFARPQSDKVGSLGDGFDQAAFLWFCAVAFTLHTELWWVPGSNLLSLVWFIFGLLAQRKRACV